MDNLTAQQRRRCMRANRSVGTTPEEAVGTALRAMGHRVVGDCREILGRPDFYLPEFSACVFVHGCFWHWHKSCRKKRKWPPNQTGNGSSNQIRLGTAGFDVR